eukprot:TRINITY_DN7321_c0_g2_i1.p1 TRINITY_DN7321_c0_g2~~TRINITY_DN7321_c0_g2_i1.p1  ORF type:complete len:166 (-),score=43.57 TRINITY_DN7321_c0_g2_i1:29-472(-)
MPSIQVYKTVDLEKPAYNVLNPNYYFLSFTITFEQLNTKSFEANISIPIHLRYGSPWKETDSEINKSFKQIAIESPLIYYTCEFANQNIHSKLEAFDKIAYVQIPVGILSHLNFITWITISITLLAAFIIIIVTKQKLNAVTKKYTI